MKKIQEIKTKVSQKISSLRIKRNTILKEFVASLEYKKIEEIRNLILKK